METILNWLLTNVVALAALILSLALYVRQWRGRREATVVVGFSSDPDSGRTDRLVLVNRGPAEAHDIRVSFRTRDGAAWDLRYAHPSPYPIPVLAPSDSFAVAVFLLLGGPDLLLVTTSWTDERRGRQTRKSSLSTLGTPRGSSAAKAVDAALGELAQGVRWS